MDKETLRYSVSYENEVFKMFSGQPIKENFILAPLKTKITIATLLRGDETLKDAPALNKSVNWHNNYFFSIFYAKPSIFPLISHCK